MGEQVVVLSVQDAVFEEIGKFVDVETGFGEKSCTVEIILKPCLSNLWPGSQLNMLAK